MEKIYKRGNMFEGADISSAQGGKKIEFEATKEEYGLNNIHKDKKQKKVYKQIFERTTNKFHVMHKSILHRENYPL